ncbi:MAG: ATP-binding protein [Candidatus Eremiobacteraeota bacterium]|nr:ATP-binding protein [Candidatus Eremiobacteraeota bacterium]
MTGRCELRINRTVGVAEARAIRNALRAFLRAIALEEMLCEDVVTAVGEALVNAIEHAYSQSAGEVEVFARIAADGNLAVDVCDRGTFIAREKRAERGLGFTIVNAIARAVSIDTNDGTTVRMIFGTRPNHLHSV